MDWYECIGPQGTRYNAEYVKESARSGRVSLAVWGCTSSRGIGLLHRIDGRLDGAQFLHILRDIMVPLAREMYPDGVINFQQDQSPQVAVTSRMARRSERSGAPCLASLWGRLEPNRKCMGGDKKRHG
jgi:hypothetical protein